MTDDLHSLAAAYVLDALDDDERRQFEAHLDDCADCSLDVADLQEAAAQLVGEEPLDTPPADLKSRVMAEIAATAQLPPQADAEDPTPRTPDTTAPDTTVTELRPRAARRPAWITLTAAAVIVVLLGFGAVLAFGGGDEPPPPNSTELAIAEMLEAPDAVTVQLEGDSPGDVTLMYSAAEERAMIVAEGLDDPGADHVYQLWTISGDEPTPSVVFTPQDGELTEEMEMTFDPPEAWAITVEPTGGSPTPTGDVVFEGTPV